MSSPFAQYFLKDGSSGTTPTTIADSGPATTVPLTMTFAGSAAWTSLGTGKGIVFDGANSSQAASAALSGTKYQTNIGGATAMVIEFVADVSSTGCIASLADSTNANQAFALVVNSAGAWLDCFIVNGWYRFPYTSGRNVYHLVIDTTAAAGSRALLYKNGSSVAVNTIFTEITASVALDNTIPSWTRNVMYVGGEAGSVGSAYLTGTVYYVALYGSLTTIAANATALAANDDADPNGTVSLGTWLDMERSADLARTLAAMSYARATAYPREQIQAWFAPPKIATKPFYEHDRNTKPPPSEARVPVRSDFNPTWSGSQKTATRTAFGDELVPFHPIRAQDVIADDFSTSVPPQPNVLKSVSPWGTGQTIPAPPQAKALRLGSADLAPFASPARQIRIVQQVQAQDATSGTTMSVSLNVKPGSALHVYGTAIQQAPSSCSDNVNGSYGTALTSLPFVAQWSLYPAAGGPTTVTVTYPAASTFRAIWVVEIENTVGVQGRAGQEQSTVAPGTDVLTSGTAASGFPASLVLGLSVDLSNGATPPVEGTSFSSTGITGWLFTNVSAGTSENKRITSSSPIAATFSTSVSHTYDTLVAIYAEAQIASWTDTTILRPPPPSTGVARAVFDAWTQRPAGGALARLPDGSQPSVTSQFRSRALADPWQPAAQSATAPASLAGIGCDQQRAPALPAKPWPQNTEGTKALVPIGALIHGQQFFPVVVSAPRSPEPWSSVALAAPAAPTMLLEYLFKEAASGTGPTLLHDTGSGAPLNATINYGTAGSFTSIGAGDGRLYDGTGSGDQNLAISGSKLQTTLGGATAFTLFMVLDSAGSSSSYDAYLSIADGSFNGLIDVTINHSQGGLIFGTAEAASPNDCLIKYAVPTSGVYVLCVVVDSTQAGPTNRARVEVNGVAGTPTVIDQIGLGVAVDAGLNWSTTTLTMGATAHGSVYYLGVAAGALSHAQTSAIAAALASNNDASPSGGQSLLPWADLFEMRMPPVRPPARALESVVLIPPAAPPPPASAGPLGIEVIRAAAVKAVRMLSEAWFASPATGGTAGDSGWGGWGGEWGGEWGGAFDPPTFTPGPWHDLTNPTRPIQSLTRAQEVSAFRALASAASWLDEPLAPRQRPLVPARGGEAASATPKSATAPWVEDQPAVARPQAAQRRGDDAASFSAKGALSSALAGDQVSRPSVVRPPAPAEAWSIKTAVAAFTAGAWHDLADMRLPAAVPPARALEAAALRGLIALASWMTDAADRPRPPTLPRASDAWTAAATVAAPFVPATMFDGADMPAVLLSPRAHVGEPWFAGPAASLRSWFDLPAPPAARVLRTLVPLSIEIGARAVAAALFDPQPVVPVVRGTIRAGEPWALTTAVVVPALGPWASWAADARSIVPFASRPVAADWDARQLAQVRPWFESMTPAPIGFEARVTGTLDADALAGLRRPSVVDDWVPRQLLGGVGHVAADPWTPAAPVLLSPGWFDTAGGRPAIRVPRAIAAELALGGGARGVPLDTVPAPPQAAIRGALAASNESIPLAPFGLLRMPDLAVASRPPLVRSLLPLVEPWQGPPVQAVYLLPWGAQDEFPARPHWIQPLGRVAFDSWVRFGGLAYRFVPSWMCADADDGYTHSLLDSNQDD